MNTHSIQDTTGLQEENRLLKQKIGEYEALITTLSEQAAQEKAAHELAIEEALRFRQLLDNIPQMAWTVLPDGRVTYCNRYWCEYTGQTPEEAQDFGWQATHHSADLPETLALYCSQIAGQEYIHENRFRRASDGMWRWHLTRTRAVQDSKGNVLLWIGTSTDIHDQKEAGQQAIGREQQRAIDLESRLRLVLKMAQASRDAERVLRENEERFRFMAEYMPHIVWTARPDGYEDFHNRRLTEYTGLDVDQSQDEGWLQIIHPEDFDRSLGVWRHSLQTGEPYEVKYRFRRHDGVYRWFLGRALPMRDDAGQIIKWFGTSTDIHEEEETKLQLESANHELTRINQVLDTFVYMAAHDLKSPVNNLAVLMQMAAEQPDPDKRQEVERMINISVKRLDQTINGLLEVISVEGSHSPARPVNFNQLMSHLSTELSVEMEKVGEGISADFSAAGEIMYVQSYLHSILRNLITNAIKYASPHRNLQVSIRTHKTPKGVVLTVADNGIGIDLKANGDRVFKPFKRFTQQAQGTGVGLYIIKTIVEKNGGSIKIESKVNAGTTFTVLLKPYK
jgi:PAS domain S-box-containing protein